MGDESDPPAPTLAAILSAELVARGWSGAELARRAGLPVRTAAHVLAGKTANPGIATVAQLLRPLGKSLGWLDRRGYRG